MTDIFIGSFSENIKKTESNSVLANFDWKNLSDLRRNAIYKANITTATAILIKRAIGGTGMNISGSYAPFKMPIYNKSSRCDKSRGIQ